MLEYKICTESNNQNLNYLQLVSNIQSSKDKLEISPKTLLKAKRKVAELEAELFQQNSGVLMETSVLFTSSQEEEFKVKIENSSVTATYNKEWIEENKDYPTLLNNFIYLFGFVDFQIRSTLVSKLSNMGVFERYLLTSSKNAYKKGAAFEQMNSLSLLQLMGYYNVLFSIGIRLEEVMEWFFKHYLSSEFNAQNFKITIRHQALQYLKNVQI